jgi:hypothetical protein
MTTDEESANNVVDISIKRIVRDNPAAFLELAGFQVEPALVRFEDTAIQQRERRADHTCIITDVNGKPRGIIYLEYQTVPDPTLIEDWIWKWIGLVKRFSVPVVILIVYVHKGNYATFHNQYTAKLDSLETTVRFDTFRLWDRTNEIRSGKYPDFIPLLALCAEHPTEATVREQVALIRSLELTEERKNELISLSFVLASRDIARNILLTLIEETFAMKTLPPIVEDMFGEVLREREQRQTSDAKLTEAGDILLLLYTKRLGTPSPEVIERLQAIQQLEQLHALIARYDDQIESWDQLLPPVQ